MSKINELIDRCPNCDGRPYVEYHSHQSQYAPRIACHECGYNILFRRGDITEKVAIKQWNDARACRKAQVDAVSSNGAACNSDVHERLSSPSMGHPSTDKIGWFLDRQFCSHPATESFNSFLKRAPQAHTIDIIMRVDGVEHRYQADILKYIEIVGLRCDICGDLHEPDAVPRECQTGDGV